MTKNILLFAFLFSFFTSFSQDKKIAKDIVTELTNKKYFGRGYVKHGDSLAAEYLSTQFSKIGLLNFGSSYAQRYAFDVNTFPYPISIKIGSAKLKTGIDFILSPESGSGKGDFETVILDSLLDSTSTKKWLNIEFTKRIFVFYHKDKVKIVQLSDKLKEKIKLCPAYIELVDDKLTASISQKQSQRPVFIVLSSVWKKNYKDGTIIKYDTKSKFIKGYATQNLVGYVPGKSKSDSVLVVSAHYDHLGGMGKVFFPGANDNATGVAMLLDMAKYYKKNPHDYTIVFILFSGEEAGLIGSKFFVDNPVFALPRISFVLNLDLVGTGNEGATVVNALEYPSKFKELEKINTEKKYLSVLKQRGKAGNSDHYNFYKIGIPSFFIYTLGGSTAYHDINDTVANLTLHSYSEVFGLCTDFLNLFHPSN